MKTRSALRWASLTIVAAAAIWGASSIHSASAGTPAAAPALVQSQAVLASLPDVAERVVPSVVNIAVTRTGGGGDDVPSMEDVDPMFRDFFGPQGPRGGQEHSLGSGVIVSADGLVLTSAHVVDGAEHVDLTLNDGRELDGVVVGTDRRSDVAVVRIDKREAHGLVPLSMGDSSALRLGEVVLAIGNPFGVGQTVTMGIVSAKGRSALGIVDYEDFIQTDAAINPGNSGGALVNLRGELVGVNTAILSRSGGNQGIGFAIPTSMIRPIMKSLVATGKVARGWLGVGIQDVDRDLAAGLGLAPGDGVVVGQVEKDSPAARAGIERGDLIRAVGSDRVHSSSELRNKIAALAPGSTAHLDVVRKGQGRAVDVVLGALPETQSARRR
jgi:Do/DeqQ family serine protease